MGSASGLAERRAFWLSGVIEVHGEGAGEGDDENDVGVVGDSVEDWSGLAAAAPVAAACRAAILSSIVGGGVCAMEPGGKRRKKLSKGFGRVFASCSYCLNEAISKHSRERIDVACGDGA